MHRIRTDAELDAALAALVKRDPRFEHALTLTGRPSLRKRPDCFAGLASIVVAQQVSTASATAILGRLRAALDPPAHTAMLRARTSKLARVGLSGAKIRTLKAIARAIADGALDFKGLVHLHADDAGWVRRADGCIKFWEGERFELLKGIALVRGGGHFPGGAMLH